MKMFNKIAIIGVGLIGGSIGLAVRKRKAAKKVVGIFRRRSTLRRALKTKAIDAGTMDYAEGVKGADLVIIATPVALIPLLAKKIAPFMDRGSIITDVGSVKGYVAREVKKVLPKWVSFVGSHPMAGSEKTGVEFADAELFNGAVTILTKASGTDNSALSRVRDLWVRLGSRVTVLSPEEHDRQIAFTSHIPHVIAQSLCLLLDKASFKYTAGGFRDTTRIAASDPDMWLDIFKTNRVQIGAALDKIEKDLDKFKKYLEKGSFHKILDRSKRAKAIRDGI